MDNYPKFAVVGHPNKGKSSIVSTLSQDDNIAISKIPGTTTQNRAFPLVVDGKTLYKLYDTPGFQRARAILAWLKKEPTRADKRADRLAKFVSEHEDNPRFADDIELLKPIISGAGIVYVVDGSKPYGAEYEAEMEILRWSGQPSMALINLIGDDDYLSQWQKALEHYFKIVRVFNPMRASFSQILEILEAMSELKYSWREDIKEVVATLKLYQKQKIKDTALIIATTIQKALTHTKSSPLKAPKEELQNRLVEEFKRDIEKMEDRAYEDISIIWNHQNLKREIISSSIINLELFSKESSQVFGLEKKELIKSATIAGALTGGSFDLVLGGHSLFLGTAIGAILGGGGAIIGIDKIKKTKVLKYSPFGSKKLLSVGPIGDINFPFILLRRLLYFSKEIANRPHANRAEIKIESSDLLGSDWIDKDTQKELLRLQLNFSKSKKLNESKEEYIKLLESVLERYIEH